MNIDIDIYSCNKEYRKMWNEVVAPDINYVAELLQTNFPGMNKTETYDYAIELVCNAKNREEVRDTIHTIKNVYS